MRRRWYVLRGRDPQAPVVMIVCHHVQLAHVQVRVVQAQRRGQVAGIDSLRVRQEA